MSDDRVLLAEFVGAHGVRGLVKVRTFTERPEAIVAYGPLVDDNGQEIGLEVRGRYKAGLLAAVAGVGDRDGAQQLQGTRLYVPRAALPPLQEPEEEFYHADLMGLSAVLVGGDLLGKIVSVQDFGAGTSLEVRLRDGAKTVLVPFTRDFVPEVDLEQGVVLIDPPPGLLD
jgi:16S rRNA processing protein RimM